MSLEAPSMKGRESKKRLTLEELKERLATHEGRFQLVPANPGPGELTLAECRLCDPDSDPETDLASVAIVSGTIYDGYSRQKFIETMLDSEGQTPEEVEHMRDRATQTVENMLELGLLTERNNVIELNINLKR